MLGFFAIVVSKLELGRVERQILATDLVIGTDDAALNQGPEAFDRIGVDRADNILTLAMVDGTMRDLLARDSAQAPSVGKAASHSSMVIWWMRLAATCRLPL